VLTFGQKGCGGFVRWEVNPARDGGVRVRGPLARLVWNAELTCVGSIWKSGDAPASADGAKVFEEGAIGAAISSHLTSLLSTTSASN
jgi:hypothetical protein